MPIPDEAIGRKKIWRETANLVLQSEMPLHLKNFCDHIGTDDASHGPYHIRRAGLASLVKKGWSSGCVGDRVDPRTLWRREIAPSCHTIDLLRRSVGLRNPSGIRA